jgi:Holin of 3TMs, for gene-transfer release
VPAPALLAAIPGLLKIGEALIDRLFPDKIAQERERAAAQQALLSMTREADLAELQVSLSAILAEAESSDPWTSRARPSFLYVMYLFILAAIPMGVVYVFRPEVAQGVADGVTAWLAAIPEPMWWLFGAGYLGYSGARSLDKWKAGAK